MKTKTAICTAMAILASMSGAANAWDGTNTNTGASVEIERGQLVRPGETVDVYDYDAGEYKSYDVDSMSRAGGAVDIEATDNATGESATLEMDDN